MRKVLLATLLLVSLVAFAQNSESPGIAVKQQLIDIEKKIALANEDCDYNYFRQIEAKEFIFTNSAGEVVTRDQDLAGEKDCHKKSGHKHDFDEVRVLSYPGSAVFNALHTISRQSGGKDFRVSTRFTDVFVWREGRWQLVADHASRVGFKN
jgi:hypothetical protein